MRTDDQAFHCREITIDELRAVMDEKRALKSIAEHFGATPVTIRKILNDYGLNFDQRLLAEWQRGTSIEQLSLRHGPKASTISGWLKSLGVVVSPGNSHRTSLREELEPAYDETKSFGKAARIIGVSRNTAFKWLVQSGRGSAGKGSK